MSAYPNGDFQIKINGIPILEDELVQLLVVLEFCVAVEQKDRVILIRQTLFVQGLKVRRQVVNSKPVKSTNYNHNSIIIY